MNQPFKRVSNFLKQIQAILAVTPDIPLVELPSFQVSKGKAKGKVPTGTGHKHMAYRRKMLKKRNKR